MQTQTRRNLPDAVAVLLYRYCHCCSSLPQTRSRITGKQLLQGRPVGISLTAGYLGDIPFLLQMMDQLVYESFLAQQRLPPHLGPDGLLSDPPRTNF